MSLKLKPYREYEDSGIPWLGLIPRNWNIRRTKYFLRESNQRSETGSEPLLRVSQYTGVTRRAREGGETETRAASLVGYKKVAQNDLVINIMLAWNGSLGVSPLNGIVSPAYCVYRFQRDIEPRYFHFLFRTDLYKGRFKVASTGVVDSRLRLYSDDFFRVEALLPPLNEQLAIVRFLTSHCTVIDRLIRAKRRVIELLNEQKQAIIHRAVTRGLDPNVPLKPSGIGLIGNIPEGWEVRRLRTIVTSIDQGVSPQAEAGLAENGAWGVLKAGCVNGGFFRQREHKKLPENFEFDPAIIVRDGDVLVSRACGSPKLVGSVGRVDALNYNLILSDKTFRLNLRDARLAEFIVASMNTPYFRMQVEQAISGAEGLANNLPISSLKDMWIVLPPADQAVELGEQIEHTSRKLNEGVATSSQEIDLLLEYRSRLIADVVTGKLDVRSVDLPELEPEDALEPLSRSDGVEFEGIPEEDSEAVCVEMGTAE